MKLSLSTNWCNRRLESGEEIADKALELGFGELELGFHTTLEQVRGFKSRLDQIPVGSIHAFCPVPISAPQGYPELYQLANFDEEGRKMALFQVRRNVKFAADMGADTVVLHAGRVMCASWFESWYRRRRVTRGVKLLDVFRKTLEELRPVLEENRVTLALENLPYFEGFPNEYELKKILEWDLGGWVKGWYDTGHARVRACNGWDKSPNPQPSTLNPQPSTLNPQLSTLNPQLYAGMHLNDVVDKTDDHLAPSFGKVDFNALADFAKGVRHVVFEPNAGVSEIDLKKGIAHIRSLWET